MTSELDTTTDKEIELPNFAPKLWGIIILMAVLIGLGAWSTMRLVATDLQRDLQSWQEKLNLIAESRTADVTQYVVDHFKGLRSLADNPSLQIYLTQLTAGDVVEESVEPAQKTYLRNLLIFTAERSGFTQVASRSLIPANVEQEDVTYGLAVLGNDNTVIASTQMSDEAHEIILAQAASIERGEEKLIAIQPNKAGQPYIGFAVPIYAIQQERVPEAQIGRVVGIKPLQEDFYGRLHHPGITEKTLESVLVRPQEDGLLFLSSLLDGSAPLSKTLPKNVASAEWNAIADSGDFVSEYKDYRGAAILATSRLIANTPWHLIVKIDRTEALANSNQRRNGMIAGGLLVIGFIAVMVLLVWRTDHSKKSAYLSEYFRKMALQSQAQERLLRLVTDHQPESIYIIDKEHKFQFANKKAAEEAGTIPGYMVGKNLVDVCGQARVGYIQDTIADTIDSNIVHYDEVAYDHDDRNKVIRYGYVPISHIPIATLPDPTPGVLVVEQDISEVVKERERRVHIQQQLVQTLITLVDKRDPHAANHSLMVSQLAGEIARHMELNHVTIETALTAGSLLNIGKIVVPSELLTKSDNLAEAEKENIRKSMAAASELIGHIEFDGPVAETLKQWGEKYNGSGALKLKGEAILMPARIVSVANVFIGMVSPRSWRDAMTVKDASQYLLDQADKQFDRRVVIALLDYLENHNGKVWLDNALGKGKKQA